VVAGIAAIRQSYWTLWRVVVEKTIKKPLVVFQRFGE